MSKTQYRRAVSMRPTTFIALTHHCEGNGISVTGFVEALILNALEAAEVSLPSREEAIAEIRNRAETRRLASGPEQDDEVTSSIFTF